MSRNMAHTVLLCGAVLILSLTNVASAQFYSYGDPCHCVQPVAQTCYQTVPVTEYREVRQTVQRPVIETEYVEQPVTEYRPVVEQRTASVPTVTYENVTEVQTVYRNAGYWQTHYQQNQKLAPCQYDPRPGFMGWLNRTGYSIRQTFTPRVSVRREYVPQVVAQQIPVTRQVARPGTRQVTYNVTSYQPHQATRRVAVNKVRYESEEVVAMRPVTVMRTVPIGTSVAYAITPYGAPTATALQPLPDPLSTRAQNKSTTRSADRENNEFGTERFKHDATNYKPKSTDGGASLLQHRNESEIVPAEYTEEAIEPEARRENTEIKPAVGYRPTRRVPSVVRMHGWAPRVETSSTGSAPADPGVALAQSNR